MSGWQDGFKDKATSATARAAAVLQSDVGSPATRLEVAHAIMRGAEVPKSFHVQLPYPPSANVYWRTTKTGQTYVSPEAKAYKKSVADVFAQRRFEGRKPLRGPVSLSINIFRPRKTGDLGNRLKVLEDALQGLAFIDDAQVVEIHMWRNDDKFNPRAVVMVEPIK